MKLKDSHTAVFGLKGEGKSNWLQYTLTQSQYENHLVYDVTKEHDALNRYTPKHRRGSDAFDELGAVTSKLVVNADREQRPEIFGIEEMSRFCGTNSPPPEAVYDLIDMNRHYGVGILMVARRPAQVHTDVMELADNVVIFYLDGENDIRKLNAWRSGLGDTVRDLDPYHFVVTQGRDWSVHKPVPEMDTTGNL